MNKFKVVVVNLFMVLWILYGNGYVFKLIIICFIYYICYLYRLYFVLFFFYKFLYIVFIFLFIYWVVILCGFCLRFSEFICDILLTVRGWSVWDVWLIRLNYEYNLELRLRLIKCMLDFFDWFFFVIFWGCCYFKLRLFI